MKWLIAAFFLLASSARLHAHDKVVKLGLDEWPPFASQHLPGFGLSAEIITQSFEKMGYKVELRMQPWRRVEQDIQQGRLDVMGNLYEIDAIKKYAAYSEPYYVSSVKFIARRDFKGNIAQLSDAQPLKIGLAHGYSFGEVFDSADTLRKTTCPLTINCILMMLAGRLDLVIDSEEALRYLVQREKKIPADSLTILPYVVIKNNMAIGVLHKHPQKMQLLDDFNSGLDYLRKTNKLRDIVNKYTSSDKL